MVEHQAQYKRLRTELDEAGRTSSLPEAPSAREALNDLLVRVRASPADLNAREKNSE